MALIVANLDAEHRVSGRGGSLPKHVLQVISAFGTLLRTFGREGDGLWTPRPVAGERLSKDGPLPRVELLAGDLENAGPADLLAWSETTELESIRVDREGEADPASPLHEMLWKLPPPRPGVLQKVMDRRFDHEMARRLGVELPHSRVCQEATDLRRHLEEGGAVASADGRWILKAPFSAAGRDRILGRGMPETKEKDRIERFFQTHGHALFEPWVERTDDFGAVGIVTETGVHVLGTHLLLVDDRGQFGGIGIRPEGELGLTEIEASGLDTTVRAVGERLRDVGYRGPFGLDAYRWTDGDGERKFQPLGEINARLTFGFVARSLAERLDTTHLGLRMGHGDVPEGSLPLLLPGAEDSTSAWVEAEISAPTSGPSG